MIVPNYSLKSLGHCILNLLISHGHGFNYLFIFWILLVGYLSDNVMNTTMSEKHPPVVSKKWVKNNYIDRIKQIMVFCLI